MTDESEEMDDRRSTDQGRLRSNVWTVSLVTSVVATILVSFVLQPMMSVAIRYLSDHAWSVARHWLDAKYSIAVAGVGSFFTMYLIGTFMYLTTGIAIFAFIVLVSLRKQRRFIQGLSKQTLNRINRVLQCTFLFLTILLTGDTIVVISGMYISVDASITYQRRIMALGPVLTDTEMKGLVRKWGMIQTQAEYDQLMQDMNKLAATYHVSIPPEHSLVSSVYW
jgi:hypothetical protein